MAKPLEALAADLFATRSTLIALLESHLPECEASARGLIAERVIAALLADVPLDEALDRGVTGASLALDYFGRGALIRQTADALGSSASSQFLVRDQLKLIEGEP